jgi:hypothetical protein
MVVMVITSTLNMISIKHINMWEMEWNSPQQLVKYFLPHKVILEMEIQQ